MIDVTNNAAKRRWMIYLDRQMQAIERSETVIIASVLNRIYEEVAAHVAGGGRDYEHFVNLFNSVMRRVLRNLYITTAETFGKIMIAEIEKTKAGRMRLEIKSLYDIFFETINSWATSQAAQRIVNIAKTTKKMIARILENALQEGDSNADIAKRIRELQPMNRRRAMKIARTETHTAAMKATNVAMASTRLKYTKTWTTAKDDRVRTKRFNHRAADGETVDKDDYYQRTGQRLFYPGDPSGSAGNIIHCRCIEFYNTVIQTNPVG